MEGGSAAETGIKKGLPGRSNNIRRSKALERI
jgi:hypothetical protein